MTPTSFVTSSCSITLFSSRATFSSSDFHAGADRTIKHRERVVAPAGFDVALPEMEQVATRLHFARPTQISWFDVQPLERVRPGGDNVVRDDGAEFERKNVERLFEFGLRQHERRRDVGVVPAGDALRTGSKIVGRQRFGHRQRVDQGGFVMTVVLVTMHRCRLVFSRAVVHERLETGAEDLAEIAFERLERGRERQSYKYY